MMKTFVNLSMVNDFPTGVGGYCKHIYKQLRSDKKFEFLFMDGGKFLSIKRILWNMFIMPLKVGDNIVYSPSTHGSLFLKNQILTIHDLIALNYPHQHRFQYFYFKYLVPLLIKNSKKIIAISEFTKSELINFYNIDSNKIDIIYNGASRLQKCNSVDLLNQQKKITNGKPYFITVGANYQHKNIVNLLKGIKIFDNTDYEFVILGKENDHLKELRGIVKENKLDNVKFVNYVSDDLLSILYQNAQANVYISKYEGFGFPPMEAASVGTVSLVSDIPIMKEIYGDTVLYVNPDSPQDIARGLTEVESKRKFNPILVRKCDDLFSKYTWEKCTHQINNLIKEIQLNEK